MHGSVRNDTRIWHFHVIEVSTPGPSYIFCFCSYIVSPASIETKEKFHFTDNLAATDEMVAELKALTAPILQFILNVHRTTISEPATAELDDYRTKAKVAEAALAEALAKIALLSE